MKLPLLTVVVAVLAGVLSAQTEQQYNQMQEAARLRQVQQQIEQARQAKQHKADLRSTLESLVGKSVISKVRIGRTATLRQGTGIDHPVTTVVEGGEVHYRAEGMFGGVDVDRGDYSLTYFASSTFRIDKLDFKGDRLELRLQTGGSDPAKLKLMLGKDWQKSLDASAVLTKLERVFDTGSERTTVAVAQPPTNEPDPPTVNPVLAVSSASQASSPSLTTESQQQSAARPPTVLIPSGSSPTQITLKQLGNMEYRLSTDELRQSAESVLLTEGEGRLDDTSYRLDTQHSATGDLDGDGIDDAIVVLWSSSGGSGQFAELVAVLNRNGKGETYGNVFLGDRVSINKINIEDRVVVVNLLEHGASDPSCCPTKQSLRRFALVDTPGQDSALAELQQEPQPTAEAEPRKNDSPSVPQVPAQQSSAGAQSTDGFDFSAQAKLIAVVGIIALVVFVIIRKRMVMKKLEEEHWQREQEFWNEVKQERSDSKAEFKAVVEKFDLLLGLGEGSWQDFIEAMNEQEGTNYTEETFKKLINVDVLSILKHISSVTGDSVRCGKIYQAVFSLLYPLEQFTVAMCMALFETARGVPVQLPFVVKAFGDFPEVYGRNAAAMLGKCAASAFDSLVLAAFDGAPRSAEADALRNQYLDLLKPYIPKEEQKNPDGSSGTRSETDYTPSDVTCSKCSEFYPVLRLEPNATEEQIKAAYRDLVQIYHPDRFNGNDRVRRTAEEEMKKVNVAYQHIVEHFQSQTSTEKGHAHGA